VRPRGSAEPSIWSSAPHGSAAGGLQLVHIFDIVDEAAIPTRGPAIRREMDELGYAYGQLRRRQLHAAPWFFEPGEDETPYLADEPHAIGDLSRHGWVFGGGERGEVTAGQGAWWWYEGNRRCR
jgi:hypothetical protein